jgi:putative transposase
MGTESPEKSRSRQALDRIPQEHREAIAAMDFFTVPTLTFGVLYCFFVIGHDRRKILGVNVTRNPNALWIVQQMREAWPYAPAPRFLLFDRDSKFGSDVVSAVRDMGSQQHALPFAARGRTGLPSVGWGAADETCRTT